MRTNDGMVLRGATPEELVEELWKSSFDAPKTRRAFMTETARRVENLMGKPIRCSSPEAFVEDLVLAGFLADD